MEGLAGVQDSVIWAQDHSLKSGTSVSLCSVLNTHASTVRSGCALCSVLSIHNLAEKLGFSGFQARHIYTSVTLDDVVQKVSQVTSVPQTRQVHLRNFRNTLSHIIPVHPPGLSFPSCTASQGGHLVVALTVPARPPALSLCFTSSFTLNTDVCSTIYTSLIPYLLSLPTLVLQDQECFSSATQYLEYCRLNKYLLISQLNKAGNLH